MDATSPLALFIAGTALQELTRLAHVHGLDGDCTCDDRDEVSAMVLSFFSSADRRTVIVNELRDAFPSLRDESDLIASLLESTDLCISTALMSQLSEISENSIPFTVLQFHSVAHTSDVVAECPGLRRLCGLFLIVASSCRQQVSWRLRAKALTIQRPSLLPSAFKMTQAVELHLPLSQCAILVFFARGLWAQPPRRRHPHCAYSYVRRCSIT